MSLGRFASGGSLRFSGASLMLGYILLFTARREQQYFLIMRLKYPLYRETRTAELF